MRILFIKGGKPGAPGLQARAITGKDGVRRIHWVKIAGPKASKPAARPVSIPGAFRAPEVRDAQGRLLAPNGKPSRLYDPAMPVKIIKIDGREIGEGPLSASLIKEWVLREQRWQDMPPVINAQTGNPIGFTVQGVKDSLKRKSDVQRRAYSGLRDLLESAAYLGFEPVREGKANEQHLAGYEVYQGALEVDGKLYGVRLKVELPKAGSVRTYKDHKIVDVEVRSPAASLGSGSEPVIGDPGTGPTQAGESTVSLGRLVGESKPVITKSSPRILFFKSRVEQFARKDVVTMRVHAVPRARKKEGPAHAA